MRKESTSDFIACGLVGRGKRTNFDSFDILSKLFVDISCAQRDVTFGTVERVTVVDHQVEIGFESFDRLVLIRLEFLLDHSQISTLMRWNNRVVSWNLNGEIRDRNVEWLSTV
jgi:hypothetical protein